MRGRISLLGAAALTLSAGACGLDGVDGGEGPGGGGSDYERIDSGDPEVEDRLDALEIVCESTFTVSGSFEPGDPPPEDHKGCWPVGTWTVSAQVDRLGCAPQPELAAEYTYDVFFDEENNTIGVSWLNSPEDDRVNLKISTAGDSLCHGSMEHFSPDFEVWALQPTLQLDGSLQGIGTFTVYDEDPF